MQLIDLLRSKPALNILQDSFDRVTFGQLSIGTTCVIPDVYVPERIITGLSSRFLQSRFMKEASDWAPPTRSRLVVQPAQGIGQNKEDSAEKLFQQLVHCETLVHLPRENQDYDIMVGERYINVFENDPFHNHDGTDMLDFVHLHYDPFSESFTPADFDEHAHMIPENMARKKSASLAKCTPG